MTSGIHLIHRLTKKDVVVCENSHDEDLGDNHEHKAFGVTIPLITTSTGQKLGKSANNISNFWLHPKLTSPYNFYQSLLNTTDDDVVPFLHYFTTKTIDEIKEIENIHLENKENRYAQTILAKEITKLVHGDNHLKQAEAATDLLFSSSNDLSTFSDSKVDHILSMEGLPGKWFDHDNIVDQPLVNIIHELGLTDTKAAAKRAIKGGGIYINNKQVKDKSFKLDINQFLNEKMCIIRFGKKKYKLAKILY
eukprot:TRINITY_DN2095_c0_g1_i1.p1 TRINITY_DN2095_c0_g1~~TRINITY_DN2095_c0_g1_i1.p1  ORF type:complete len:250 (+),score=50.99 TRINITY_DN2095_c0_g1_i1:1-750(+)